MEALHKARLTDLRRMKDSQLATQEQSLVPADAHDTGNILSIISRAAQDPSIDVEKMERLLGMAERMESRQSERAFAEALVALQGETIRVQATKKVDEKNDGSCRYKFAPYEEIMAKVQPMLTGHGFSITFDTEIGDQRLTSICTLTHKSGHSRQNRFAVRYGKPPGSSDAQGDMSTKSYAKRGALCDCLNISIEHDTDGADTKVEGGPITQKQADDLRDWIEAVGGDERKFLATFGFTKFEEINAANLPLLHSALRAKEASKK
jgi:hypothetical protein